MSRQSPRTPGRLTPILAGPTPLVDAPNRLGESDAGSRLCREFRLAWRRGERVGVEQFLARRGAVSAEQTIQLIGEELCLRQELGEQVDATEMLARFPQWRAELELLLACDAVFQELAPPAFPEVGEELGEFHLHAELGRGATGRVFLATQPALSDRPVVLKCTSFAAAEHLSLARLQHSGIVPLYLVRDFPSRGLRALCMPYLGGASLAAVLDELKEQPPAQRSGRSLLAALDRLQTSLPAALAPPSDDERFLAASSYVEVACWIAARLADALDYAHRRGLVHLDLKPSNVLLAADRQPMLLDFHLARSPLPAGAGGDEWLGGTPGYMAPEHAAAVAAIREGREVTTAVDARADVYSLGVLLYELLGGPTDDEAAGPRPPLRALNPHVSLGLEDLLARCLKPEAAERYGDAAAVADDLRRHLADLPLLGAANRSLSERWRKWRRRKPQTLARLIAAGVLGVTLAGGGWLFVGRQADEARRALVEAQSLLDSRAYSAALERLRGGLDRLAYVPGHVKLKRELTERLDAAKRLRLADDLHRLVERLRFLDSSDWLPAGKLGELDDGCRAIWAARAAIVGQFTAGGGEAGGKATADGERAQQVRNDLVDLAVLWPSLRLRQAAEAESADARREALAVLAEAETVLGPNPILEHERAAYESDNAGRDEFGEPSKLTTLTHWQRVAWARFLIRAGRFGEAADQLAEALDESPQSFWPNYELGLCRYRQGLYEEALQSFSACVALAPDSGDCYYNRGLAHAALGQVALALADYGRALRCDPHLAVAALHRSALLTQANELDRAAADLKRAAADGADMGQVHYQWALWHLARHDRKAALASLREVLARSPNHRDAAALLERLEP